MTAELIYNFLTKADEILFTIFILLVIGALCIITGIFILSIIVYMWNSFMERR